MPEPHSKTGTFELVEAKGPWPFTTRRTFRQPDSSLAVWRSRHHRKGLQRFELSTLEELGRGLRRALWMPRDLNWWIAMLFAIGALLFAAGCVFVLVPAVAEDLSFGTNEVNAVFFVGSVPFTTAAYLQLYQTANAKEFGPSHTRGPHRSVLLGWEPHNIGWLGCVLQFLGTLFFNINTLDAMNPNLTWLQQDLEIWVPNFLGSLLFLASGYLAYAETCHGYFAWKPSSVSWWITGVNLLGCVAFMISAVFAFVPAKVPPVDALSVSVAFTFVGAIAFLMGSLLMLPEAAGPEGDDEVLGPRPIRGSSISG